MLTDGRDSLSVTGVLNNELYIGRLVWNRLRYIKDPATGKRVSRINPPEDWITADVPELRIVDNDLWQAVKDRQNELAVKYASTIEAVRAAHANRLNRTIRRPVLEERLLAGLRDRLMAPEVAAEAMRAYAEETNRLNRERRSSVATDRKELAGVEKTIKDIVTIIENGGYTRALIDRLRELEARQDELTERLSGASADIPDIHPNVAGIYRRKVERLAEALQCPEDRDEVSAAIRGLIERITLSPGPKRGQIDAVLYGDLGAIIGWTAARDRRAKENRTDTRDPRVSVSVVAGARHHRYQQGLFQAWA